MEVKLTREWLERKLTELDEAGVDEFIVTGSPPSDGTRVRAKMRCNAITNSGSSRYPSINVQLGAVYSNDPQSENRSFAKATPSASVSLNIDAGMPAAHAFALEREYYVDFLLVSTDVIRYVKDGLPPVACRVALCKRDGSEAVLAEYTSDNGQVVTAVIDGEEVCESPYNGVRLPELGYTHWRYLTSEEEASFVS